MKRLTDYDTDDLYALDPDEIDELCVQHQIDRYDNDGEIDTDTLREKLRVCREEILQERSEQ